ncbi:hypothetical protein EPI10_022770 [Gossypium australe]|uniref:Uncharacterized protein n=1 Tax=Gossypium australe TaxID=47621 RepID=A0A5B6VSQ8_9ROSI|nr:hypothetical protein EPI10_022770 [Gossypium australe]
MGVRKMGTCILLRNHTLFSIILFCCYLIAAIPFFPLYSCTVKEMEMMCSEWGKDMFCYMICSYIKSGDPQA